MNIFLQSPFGLLISWGQFGECSKHSPGTDLKPLFLRRNTDSYYTSTTEFNCGIDLPGQMYVCVMDQPVHVEREGVHLPPKGARDGWTNKRVPGRGVQELIHFVDNIAMSASPPPLTTPPQVNTFAQQAAKGSWVCAAMIFGVLALGSRSGAKVILDLVALLLMVVGLVLGIIALFGIPRHGIRGILAPALVGIAINGLFVFIFITNFAAARARAREAVKKAALPALVNPSSGITDVRRPLFGSGVSPSWSSSRAWEPSES